MGRKIFVTIVGKGPYSPCKYRFLEKKSAQASYVQQAELEILGAGKFDAIYLICTKESFEAHFDKIAKAVEALNGPVPIQVPIQDSANDVVAIWSWFYDLLRCIQDDDEIVFDVTHGWRMISIVFSTAIHFLRRVRHVRIRHVLYGVFNKEDMPKVDSFPIVDLADFYAINDWAEGVGRLVDSADTKKLAQLVAEAPKHQFGQLADEAMVNSLQELGTVLTNVDVNHVGNVAGKALAVIRERLVSANTTPAERLLLESVLRTFSDLAVEPHDTWYDEKYFELQIVVAGTLIKYEFFMQAYTVMRECLGSLGMAWRGGSYRHGDREKRLYADLFCCMLGNNPEKWKFSEDNTNNVEKLKVYYQHLVDARVLPDLASLYQDLAEIRNGFDHAWTARKSGVAPDIATSAQVHLTRFSGLVRDAVSVIKNKRPAG